jgi:hypothetical protein
VQIFVTPVVNLGYLGYACSILNRLVKYILYYFAAWTINFQIMMKERPTKCISKVNHIFRISILLLHVSALQERHLQEAQSILMKLCVCYVISAEWEWLTVCVLSAEGSCSAEICRSKIDILNIWFTLKMHSYGLSLFITFCFVDGNVQCISRYWEVCTIRCNLEVTAS